MSKIYSLRIVLVLFLVSFLYGCNYSTGVEVINADEDPVIYPDYKNIVIPYNIAPLNFKVESEGTYKVLLESKNKQIELKGKEKINISINNWREIIDDAINDKIRVTIFKKGKNSWKKFNAFYWEISSYPIDPYLTYRLIEPTYANWNEMGVYQRELSSFKEKEILSNKKTENNCINCHAFNSGDPNQMTLHLRKINPGTLLVKDGKVTKLNTKSPYTISNFVYPYWHPKGDDIAFSTNNTQMSFYESNNKSIEVYDLLSDIIIYNIKQNEIYTSPLLSATDQLENFPVFSPDGRKLYFCTSPVIENLPEDFEKIKYKLCSIDFDPDKQQFGNNVDTLIDLTSENKGISLPSISPDGKYIICSVAENGCFLSWNKDSELYLYDIKNKSLNKAHILNSENSDSFTNWSSNTKWLIFSSRRLDGIHNRVFISHINDDGVFGKPFVLPQEDPDFYKFSYKTYNLPQLITNQVTVSPHYLSESATSEPTVNVQFRGKENTNTNVIDEDFKSDIN